PHLDELPGNAGSTRGRVQALAPVGELRGMAGPARLRLERSFERRELRGRRALRRQRLSPVSLDEILDEVGAAGRRGPEEHGRRRRGRGTKAKSHRREHDSVRRLLYSRTRSYPDRFRRTLVDPYRLPRHVRPTRYDLRLEPDLATLTFTGDETVTLEIDESTAEVVLNAIDLSFGDATITSARGDSVRGTPVVDEAGQRCRITFPSPIAPGTWRLRLAFTGTLNDKLR